MPFTISVTGDTLEECVVALVQEVSRIRASTGAVEQPAQAPIKPTPEQVAAVDDTASFKPAPAVAPAPDAEALRTEIRALLTPLMRGDKAAAARALVKSYGDGISSVPEDKLPELLAKAKELA